MTPRFTLKSEGTRPSMLKFVILSREGIRNFRGAAMNHPIPGVCLAKDVKETKALLRFLRETTAESISSAALFVILNEVKNPLGRSHRDMGQAAPAGSFAPLRITIGWLKEMVHRTKHPTPRVAPGLRMTNRLRKHFSRELIPAFPAR
ncbi:MAG: hypothetical protein ABIZ81_13250 [Opitutaceae bacterium]